MSHKKLNKYLNECGASFSYKDQLISKYNDITILKLEFINWHSDDIVTKNCEKSKNIRSKERDRKQRCSQQHQINNLG